MISRIKIVDIFCLYVFSVPLFNSSKYSFICNILFLFFFLMVLAKKIIKFDKYVFFLCVYIGWIGVSSVLTGFSTASLKMCYSICSLGIMVILMQTILEKKDVRKIENSFIAGSMILVLIDAVFLILSCYPNAVLGSATVNPNNAGVNLAFSSVFIANRVFTGKQVKSFILWIVLEFLVLCTQSRSSILLSVIGILSILFINLNKMPIQINKNIMVIFIILMFLISIAYCSGFLKESLNRFLVIREEIRNTGTSVGSVAVRMNLKQIGWQAFLEKPGLGHGIGMTSNYFRNIYFHDNYIQLLFEIGITGIISYYMPFIICLISSVKNKEVMAEVILICIFIEGVFDVTYHNKIYYILFGICILLNKKESIGKNSEYINYWAGNPDRTES